MRPKKNDLINRRFGKWAVIKLSEIKNYKKYWLCKCECGNEKVVDSYVLKTGKSQSCGSCPRREDLTGIKFGKWTVIKFAERRDSDYYWLCRCECGKEKLVQRNGLISGRSQSCGECRIRYEDLTGKKFGSWTVIEYAYKKGSYNYWLCGCECGNRKVIDVRSIKLKEDYKFCRCNTHKKSKDRVYRIWVGIKARCLNPNSTGYENYGAKGIKIYSEWINSFESFYKDMGDPPSPNYSVDRIDPNGYYEPGNCRWATREQQDNNRTDSIKLTANGRTQTIAQWVKEIGIDRQTILGRLERGWSEERAISTPLIKPKRRKKLKKIKSEPKKKET